jgi:hypothetical protein
MKKILSLLISALAALLASCASWGADPHASRGGVAEETASHHLELVAKDRTLTLYVDDHKGKPIDVSKLRARASLFSGKDKGNVDLAPAGGGVLKGDAPFAIASDAKIVLTLTLEGGKPAQVRFQLGAKQDHKGHKH